MQPEQPDVNVEISKNLRKLEYLIKERGFCSLGTPIRLDAFDNEELKPIKKLYDEYEEMSKKLYNAYQARYKTMLTKLIKRKIPMLVKEIRALAKEIK